MYGIHRDEPLCTLFAYGGQVFVFMGPENNPLPAGTSPYGIYSIRTLEKAYSALA
jgi:hypothetical protein